VRLPWPFSRPDAAPAETSAPPDRAMPIAAPPRPQSTGAWASLPPIQRSIGAAPLVASSETFYEAVPGFHPLPPILEPLGHDVTTVAPAGLMGAPVHTVASLTSSASLVPPPPVQRRAEHATDAVVAAPAEAGPPGRSTDSPAWRRAARGDSPATRPRAHPGRSADTAAGRRRSAPCEPPYPGPVVARYGKRCRRIHSCRLACANRSAIRPDDTERGLDPGFGAGWAPCRAWRTACCGSEHRRGRRPAAAWPYGCTAAERLAERSQGPARCLARGVSARLPGCPDSVICLGYEPDGRIGAAANDHPTPDQWAAIRIRGP
jgi:hypothetical protein